MAHTDFTDPPEWVSEQNLPAADCCGPPCLSPVTLFSRTGELSLLETDLRHWVHLSSHLDSISDKIQELHRETPMAFDSKHRVHDSTCASSAGGPRLLRKGWSGGQGGLRSQSRCRFRTHWTPGRARRGRNPRTRRGIRLCFNTS